MNQVLKNRTEAPFLQAVRLEVLCEYSLASNVNVRFRERLEFEQWELLSSTRQLQQGSSFGSRERNDNKMSF